ncbi:MAG: nucleotidyltransferase domain-containing protein [Desulfobacterales bacterium]|nr:nucleotidyltransferase domain-containing protein [Desulfobacterales bacterium]
MKIEEIKRIAEELIAKLRPEVKVVRIYAYGSQVRGEAVPGSDLDFLIEVPEKSASLKRRIQNAAWELSLEKEIVISVVVVSESEFHYGPLSVSCLARNIEREGIEIAA